MIKITGRRNALILAAAAAFVAPKVARTAGTSGYLGGLTSLTPIQKFGFRSSATAAVNTAAATSALAAGVPLCILPESNPFLIASPIILAGSQTLVGLNQHGCTIQPPSNTGGIQLYGSNNFLQGITVAYAAQEVAANTNSVAFTFGGTPNPLAFSYIGQISAFQANQGIAQAGQGSFQNILDGAVILLYSNVGMNMGVGDSGGLYNNINITNTGETQTSTDCTSALSLQNFDNGCFNSLNLEKAYPGTDLLNIASDCSVVFNSLHIEGATNPFFGKTIFALNSCDISINNLTICFCRFNKAAFDSSVGGSVFATDGASRVMINGYLEHDNTFGATLPALFSPTSGTKIWLRGNNTRNTGNIVIPARTGMVQFDDTTFDVAGGRLVTGLVGTTPPASGGMPAPFTTTAGAALPWVVGDRMNNTTPTATSTTGWRCTTGGSPGTWTAESIL